jgi:hypothetical protein
VRTSHEPLIPLFFRRYNNPVGGQSGMPDDEFITVVVVEVVDPVVVP